MTASSLLIVKVEIHMLHLQVNTPWDNFDQITLIAAPETPSIRDE